jgi:DNA-binding transcriptional LysR family regulator
MDNWDEVKTAYQVVRLGTVSAAADELRVHRATVIRHIDALEAELGEKLFQRHARGYTPTEAGLDLLRVARATEEQFSHFVGRSKGRTQELSGEFIITSLEVVAGLLIEPISIFQEEHPDVQVRLITSERLFHLEYGEAHLALRAGTKPDQPDNVVRLYSSLDIGLYASKGYIERFGKPLDETEFKDHRFIGPENRNIKAPILEWMRENVPNRNISFRASSPQMLNQAIETGIGIGYLQSDKAKRMGMVEIVAPRPEWRVNAWLVTHVDLHRTPKVQAFLKILKETGPKG